MMITFLPHLSIKTKTNNYTTSTPAVFFLKIFFNL